jgi:hypothetical protein
MISDDTGKVELWSGRTAGPGALGVRLLSEFADPWSAVVWALHHGGPGVYCLAGLRPVYGFKAICFKVIDTREVEMALADLDVLLALEESRRQTVA